MRNWLPIDLLRVHGNFDFAMEDVDRLLKLHSEATKRNKGRPSRDLEVFKRAAVILAITAWETFIEDAIQAGATSILEAAKSPADVEAWFNSVAHDWLGKGPKPPALVAWTGGGWKELLKERMEDELERLNTPDARNVRTLSKCYLGIDLPRNWFWARTTPDVAAERLRKLIRLRGELVHRSRKYFVSGRVPKREQVILKHVVEGTVLLRKPADCTVLVITRTGEAVTTRPAGAP